MGEGWVEMGNDDSSRRKGVLKGSVERAGTTMAITYLTYFTDFFLSVCGFTAAKTGCFSPHIAADYNHNKRCV